MIYISNKLKPHFVPNSMIQQNHSLKLQNDHKVVVLTTTCESRVNLRSHVPHTNNLITVHMFYNINLHAAEVAFTTVYKLHYPFNLSEGFLWMHILRSS